MKIGDPYRHKEAQQITLTDNNRSMTGDHHHHITNNSLLRRTIDNYVVLITTEINQITDLQGSLHIDKTINKEKIGHPAHIDQIINQTGSQAPTEIMIIETDQTVQIETNIGPITNITDYHLHTTDKITETLHITVSNKTTNIKEMITEEVTHHYHLLFNQEPIVDQITEDL